MVVKDRQSEASVRLAAGPLIEDIYREQWAPLVRLALAMTGDRERAQDIVHDVFFRLASRPLPEDPPSYLRKMVVNATRDHHRRLSLERRVVHPVPEPVFLPELDEMLSCLQTLPPRQRHALALRYYADLSIEQISRLLACPKGTVKSLIHRGLETLRKELDL